MRILQVLTYYRPHISGLTIYVQRLARGLVRAGHHVTVLTSQYERTLPLIEDDAGARIERAPIVFRVSKGVIMPSFGNMARRLIRQHDVVHLHLPQFDGAGLALNARRLGKPVVLTYHCDIRLPPGLLNTLAGPVIHLANEIAARYSNQLVSYTDDYARHSPFLSRHRHKLCVIPPPVEIEPATPEHLATFAAKWKLHERPVIGMVARLASEKGVEVLVKALQHVRQVLPTARVLFAGPYRNVLGEEAYARRLQPAFDALGPLWTFTGSLQGAELAALYTNCDVTVLPSLNSTESFGLVQVESMLCGTPSICSDLPGVRVPVQTTGMGKVVPIGDHAALAEAIIEVTRNRSHYVKPRHTIEHLYSTERSVREYERLYRELTNSSGV
ncbi:MAG: glycosyltransferase family 4 protein [Anaerolineae bacterium]|nr:glycosyltransferase family 4 protein [Thermoflexales bacterium]MDW8408400.1 glycosyltransferase family 4 protein [Anaerolineae bacterium]